jgi:hypothetical protein
LHPSQEQIQRQMQRILQSAEFRNAHTLQHLLEFLVAQACGPDAETLKESTIGLGVFNRPPDFDPKADPVVRVQVHRLRQKLQEYYETDGSHDPVLIEIPKGTYLPVFEEVANHGPAFDSPSITELEATALRDAAVANHAPESGVEEAVSIKNWRSGKLLFGTVLAVATVMVFFALGFWFGKGQLRTETESDRAPASTDLTLNRSTDPVQAFWSSLLGNDPTPIIAHADAVFLLDSNSDLFWFPHGESDYRGAPVDPGLARQFAANPELVARAGKLYYEDSYLGSGDLDAIGILANLFGEMGRKPRILAGKDLTPADLQQHNVILVGSSFQSYAVAQFNTLGDFSFKSSQTSNKDWSGLIENAHPRPGEARLYRTERDPATRVVKLDHALITIEPGVNPGRYIADFGGLDTTGSEGAALFATSKAGVEELSKALVAQGIHGANGGPPLFQALLSVRLEKGHEVLGSSLLAVHPLVYSRSEGPAAESANTSTR